MIAAAKLYHLKDESLPERQYWEQALLSATHLRRMLIV